ncbi:hypothetical protein ACIPJS_17590 [Streptomyces sp. NPDC086783]|uniref:hypothetical protein n=1 Tax=Streptomyces sp. NPDC086783 TaxID=3365758 RepID=UPI00381DC4B8
MLIPRLLVLVAVLVLTPGTMPTYHEIMTTDLSSLVTAAERWDGMAGEFEKREAQYRRDVYGVSVGRSWEGMSADAAHARFDITLKEFQAAQTEAKALASLLRDAHAQFVELRGKVKAVRREAVEAGMRVSERGVVSYAGQNASAHPDAGHAQRACTSTSSWQDSLDRAVRAVADADRGVEIALKAVTVDSDVMDGTCDGFNSRARGDIEKYEAEAADAIALRLNGGAELSDRDVAELRRTFRDNGQDKAFSRTFLDGLGAGGTIRMTNRLHDLIHVRGGKGVRDFSAIESGLARTLATATKDTKSKWYEEWRRDMRKAGVERYETDFQGARLDKARGYQSLVTLMQKGDGYAPQFLKDLGDDIIRAEKSDPDVWDLKGGYSGRRDGWFANDPLDGLLGVMSHDPDTAASYLKSDDRMKYLMEERDWKVVEEAQEGAKAPTYGAALDKDDRAGFGAALQAATTGIDPSDKGAEFVPHSEENKAILRSTVRYLADSGDDFPPSLREPVARILANHGDTVHVAASSIDMSEAPLKQEQLIEVMKQVSRDQGAYGTLNRGMNQALVAAIHEPDQRYPDESLLRAGRTVGFLEEARAQVAAEPKTAELPGKWMVDQAIGHLPVGSGEVQAGVDYVTERWLADEQRRYDEKAADEKVATYENRSHQLTALTNEWWKVHGHGTRTPYDRQDDTEQAAEAGINRAQGISG